MTAQQDDLSPQRLRALAESRGLGRAFDLYPAMVAAAVERGRHALGDASSPAFSPTTEPAVTFNPEKFAGDR